MSVLNVDGFIRRKSIPKPLLLCMPSIRSRIACRVSSMYTLKILSRSYPRGMPDNINLSERSGKWNFRWDLLLTNLSTEGTVETPVQQMTYGLECGSETARNTLGCDHQHNKYTTHQLPHTKPVINDSEKTHSSETSRINMTVRMAFLISEGKPSVQRVD